MRPKTASAFSVASICSTSPYSVTLAIGNGKSSKRGRTAQGFSQRVGSRCVNRDGEICETVNGWFQPYSTPVTPGRRTVVPKEAELLQQYSLTIKLLMGIKLKNYGWVLDWDGNMPPPLDEGITVSPSSLRRPLSITPKVGVSPKWYSSVAGSALCR